jgi:hypothetical protein
MPERSFFAGLFMEGQSFKVGKTLEGYHLSRTMLGNLLYIHTGSGETNLFYPSRSFGSFKVKIISLSSLVEGGLSQN